MAEQTKPPVPIIDHLLDAPVIYFDAVPSLAIRATMLSAVLAVHVGKPVTSTSTHDHIVAVAHLRFTLATATVFRDSLDKMLLAAAATPGPAN